MALVQTPACVRGDILSHVIISLAVSDTESQAAAGIFWPA